MLKLVLDTDVLFAAFRSSTGASRRLLIDILDGRAALLLSTTLLVEYEAVLTRKQNLEQFGLSAGDVISVLDELAGICLPVVFDYRWRPRTADPDDDLVLETAINGMADVIASFNLKDFGTSADPFGIAVERPIDLLRRLAP